LRNFNYLGSEDQSIKIWNLDDINQAKPPNKPKKVKKSEEVIK